MLTVESRKFCCCLPVRLGVFILSLLAMVGGSIVAAVGWISVSQLKTYPVDIVDEIALYIHSSIFTLLGVLGTFGFVGSLVRSRAMVTAFSVGIAIHLGLSIGSGVFTIYSVFKQAPDNAIAACMEGKTDDETRKICQTGMSLVKGAIVAIYVIAWLIELYAYFIVDRYSDQLEDEEMAKLAPVVPQSVNPPVTMIYNGYPQRFSYSAYADSRRGTFMDPRTAPVHGRGKSYDEGGVVGADNHHYDQSQGQGRPQSEYAFALPSQAYGVQRGKDATNLA
ncbi:hypothetical protein FA13DRAFT_1637836 [Coprinellus micaceus]|uniref:Uncharacterized protein n=1 Tax=Coprinellus micaceus TaxID=71717 RepID=A0A4Y7R8S9_COPMI|nr:hypothetical protein FA13DRAFT_1760340 [Coprinellus micaceus]TEB25044.1 hypothetical protein FA13DRAFT_1637836 [Coprinellus micaceus]